MHHWDRQDPSQIIMAQGLSLPHCAHFLITRLGRSLALFEPHFFLICKMVVLLHPKSCLSRPCGTVPRGAGLRKVTEFARLPQLPFEVIHRVGGGTSEQDLERVHGDLGCSSLV